MIRLFGSIQAVGRVRAASLAIIAARKSRIFVNKKRAVNLWETDVILIDLRVRNERVHIGRIA